MFSPLDLAPLPPFSVLQLNLARRAGPSQMGAASEMSPNPALLLPRSVLLCIP